jgi:acetyl esterase/lipase
MTLALRIARSILHRPPQRHRYGALPHQVCDLHKPTGGSEPHPVAVVLHGGYWQPPYTKLIMRPLCQDLTKRGYAAWNVEYRRLGRDGGGWPMTFDDVAAAIDLLADLEDARLDLRRVTLIGHSAGGQLALWAAGRAELPAGAVGAGPRVVASRVLALAAVCDMARAEQVAARLLGGSPSEVPDRWQQANPIRRIPLAVPVALVHGTDDETVSVQRSREYAAAAAAAGAPATLVETPGGHQDQIDPSTAAWRAAAEWLGAG